MTTLEIDYMGIHWSRNAILYMANFRISDVSLDPYPGGFRVRSDNCQGTMQSLKGA